MRQTAIAVAAAAGFALLVITQIPQGEPVSSAEGSAPQARPWVWQDEGATSIPRPPDGTPAASADPYAAERGRALKDAYSLAASAVPTGCGLTPVVLAAVGQVESGSAGGRAVGPDHRLDPPIYGPLLDGGSRAAVPDTDGGSFDGSKEWDRSMGLMQMLPDTWWAVGVDGDGDSLADPQNVYDAALAVGRHLCDGGRSLASTTGLREAVYAYRGSAGYVEAVLDWVQYFTAHGLESLGDVGTSAPPEVRAAELDAPTVVAAMPGQPTVTAEPAGAVDVAALLPPSLTNTRGSGSFTVARPRSTSSTTSGSTARPATTTTTPPRPSNMPTTTTPPLPTTTTPPPTTTTPPPTTTTPLPTTTTPLPTTTTTVPPPVTTTNPPTTTDPPPPPTTTSDPPPPPPTTTSDPPPPPPSTTSDPPPPPPSTTSDPPPPPPSTTSDPPPPPPTTTSEPPPTTTEPSTTSYSATTTTTP
ncbi:lytic transglycosylase domain-containing protein [Knoellia sp. p5-6-4]|uniref:lytic transglycosylase domain-containing protein n=1 Tax=unclassified Knoellia TaxID=2618719 RepID=UPI0023DB30BD|nr:lytic transglycosylase domain-containing protein [Knoellia sp. p5-6-4]MDF2146307.1 lytic transglycosylase domain-containing protein [Knoellia sp. p5-6-4]